MIHKIILGVLNRTARFWPDRLFLQLKYRLIMGKKLNLDNPQTFNEKLNWLKLYNRRPEYTQMVDKYAVKEYVASKIGGEYIIPTLGVWNTPEEIDWDILPNQFVLKTTHGGGSGGVVICKNKAIFDKKEACCKLQRSLNSDIYVNYREWPYKNVPKRIIAEKYMANWGEDLEDYKVHNFNGIPKIILVCRNRNKEFPMVEDFYTTDWTLLDLRRPSYPNSQTPQIKPNVLNEMLKLAAELSKNIPFLRTDFYIIEGKVYFGEITFFPAAGMDKFEPMEWDDKLGNLISLSVSRDIVV